MKVLDNAQWVEEHFSNCDLGDPRRNKRLQTVAKNMLDAPDQSLCKQNTKWSDLKAAYGLFNRPEATLDSIASSHWNKTRDTKPGRYLLISDTTDIDHFSHKATTGLGMLGSGVGRGFQLHNCLMYDCDNEQIVGEAGAILFKRKHVPKDETRTQRLKRYRESSLWGDLVDRIGPSPEGSQWVHVFDRGGDSFETMCHIVRTGDDWVIRASRLSRKVIDNRGEKVSLRQAVGNAMRVGTYELSLRSRPGVKARTATMEILVAEATFPRPSQVSPKIRSFGIEEITMNVVVVREVNAPKGVSSIEWVLLTSLPAATLEDAWQVVSDYENRWLIEEYHKVLKSGCNLEGHSLRSADRLEAQIALTSVIGVRLFQLKLVGRNDQTAKARNRIPHAWLRCLAVYRPKLKLTKLTVYEFFRQVANLGGFIGRKSDGEPGWHTIWYGFQKLQLLVAGMELADTKKA
ncbi:IS4 family transposase [Stieleria varia]|uniref:IS4 family transposase n=1 Tax=Stieleria varia TaxID=2528005 RepID=UPI00313CD5F3